VQVNLNHSTPYDPFTSACHLPWQQLLSPPPILQWQSFPTSRRSAQTPPCRAYTVRERSTVRERHSGCEICRLQVGPHYGAHAACLYCKGGKGPRSSASDSLVRKTEGSIIISIIIMLAVRSLLDVAAGNLQGCHSLWIANAPFVRACTTRVKADGRHTARTELRRRVCGRWEHTFSYSTAMLNLHAHCVSRRHPCATRRKPWSTPSPTGADAVVSSSIQQGGDVLVLTPAAARHSTLTPARANEAKVRSRLTTHQCAHHMSAVQPLASCWFRSGGWPGGPCKRSISSCGSVLKHSRATLDRISIRGASAPSLRDQRA
jgi:hypothetical protein